MILARTVVALVALVLVLVPGSSAWKGATAQATERQTAPDPPKLRATAWVLVDADTGLYLAGKNPDRRLPIASTTKIMTALLTLEDGANLDEEVRSEEHTSELQSRQYLVCRLLLEK